MHVTWTLVRLIFYMSACDRLNSAVFQICSFIASIKESPRAEDCDEIYLPGEIELNRAEQAQREGMEISDVVVKELEEISMKYKVPFN